MNFIKKFFNNLNINISSTSRGEEINKTSEPKTYPIADLLAKVNFEEKKDNPSLEKNTEGGEKMATAKEMEKLLAQVVKDNGLEGAVIADAEGLHLRLTYLPVSMKTK